ncbi:MAG: hypothetical protein A3K03_04565 [Bdellovibrionales bacterium RIFOXYD1_FULL_44_7]|nr:MAG: hypothetical protein A3K03_04565 [Bdellovibrionales bacterium RIFOXYD1_FULL_44_7]
MTDRHFDIAFRLTMQNEGLGKLTNDSRDPGGMTYSGISRRYWPEWAGWVTIDQCEQPFPPDTIDHLTDLTKSFYRVNFWNRMQGDEFAEISPAIAYEVFDTAVNMDVTRAVEFLQTGYNVGRGEYGADLEVDGRLGPKTLEAIRNYMASKPGTPALNEEILLNCMNGEQYIFYKANPRRKYFRGWFRRV